MSDDQEALIKEDEEQVKKVSEQDNFDGLRLLEAILFSTPDLLTVKDLKPFFPEEADIPGLLRQLDAHYTNRGVQVVCRGQAWGFRTAPDLASNLEITEVVNKPLSGAATEILAIIAYHQPVTKADIEQIRGVSVSKSTMDILLKEDLIRPGRRRETPGRPMTWKTTDHFLDYFSLESLKDLPNLKELKESGLLTVEPPMLDLKKEAEENEDGQEELALEDTNEESSDENSEQDQEQPLTN